MTAFDDAVDEYVGTDGVSDIRAIVRPCYDFDFDGYPVRLWRGQGRLFTTDGKAWLGTIDAAGRDHLTAPGFNDGRDGSAALLQFGLPYIDEATYLALRNERWRVTGRKITRYMAVFQVGEGLRPQTPIDYDAHFYMQGTQFKEQVVLNGLTMVRQFPITVTAKNGNAGRSQARRGTYTPTGQRERAFEMFGIEGDKGCDFIPELANKTFTRP